MTATLFRKMIRDAGLTIEEPFSRDNGREAEKTFAFVLERGVIVTTRNPLLLLHLLRIASDVWGKGKGEHKELLSTHIVSGDLSFPNAVWRPRERGVDGLAFRHWIEDQFLFFAAARLSGFT